MTIDDRKNTERIELRVTERMLLDLSRMAALQERSLADFVRLILRNHAYGHCRTAQEICNDAMSVHERGM